MLQTDDRQTGDSIYYSEREREFTFAKNCDPSLTRAILNALDVSSREQALYKILSSTYSSTSLTSSIRFG